MVVEAGSGIVHTETRTIKTLFLGDYGVGKTTFILRHRTGEFEKRYCPTEGVQVDTLRILSNKGMIRFSVWDHPESVMNDNGLIKPGIRSNESGAAIIMFDLTSKRTWKSVPKWIKLVRDTDASIPIVVVGNKVDCVGRVVTPKNITDLMKKIPFRYFDISSKSNYNFEKPFLFIARKILGDDTNFVESEELPVAESSSSSE